MRDHDGGEESREPVGRFWLAVLLSAFALLGPAESRAQDIPPEIDALGASCGGTTNISRCREAAVILRSVQGGLGFLAAGGAQVPGSASTLGKRFGGLPRFSASLRGAVARIAAPDHRVDPPGLPDDPYWGMTAQGSLDVGVFEGFSIVPTVGGVLALDVFGSAGVILLPEGRGFDGNTSIWGGGVNVGLLRESFTMPGVTVSGAWRTVGEVQLGSTAAGDAVEVQVAPTVTSVRAVVGKDLLALGLLGGVGWDRYSSDGRIAVETAPGEVAGRATADGFHSSRKLVFGGVSWTMLVLQLSAEGGVARGFDPVPVVSSVQYKRESSSFFFSVAGRLTL